MIMLSVREGVLPNDSATPPLPHAASKTCLMSGAVRSERAQGSQGKAAACSSRAGDRAQDEHYLSRISPCRARRISDIKRALRRR
jgi:hypothetical protein